MELSTSQGVTFKRTSTVNPNEDSGAAAGWSIGDTYHYLGASWTASGSDKPILIAIKGTLYVTPTNSTATGHPSVAGTPILRSTLTAGPGTIDDANGLDNTTYSYQWFRIDGNTTSNILDAVNSTYTLTTDDIGKSIKVTASFTDDDGYSEARTSNPVGPVTAVTCAAPDLGGRVEVWRAVVTVKPIFAGVLFTGYGYVDGLDGELSDTSFEFDSRTATVTEIRLAGSGPTSRLYVKIDVDFDPTTDQEFIDVPGLPTLQSLRLHACDAAWDVSAPMSALTNGVSDCQKTPTFARNLRRTATHSARFGPRNPPHRHH